MPYGLALLKLYAGSMKNPLCDLVGHDTGPRVEVGDEAGEPALDVDTSYSARRHASEQ